MPFELVEDNPLTSENLVLSERQCYHLIKAFISFPYSQICVHYAAGLIIQEMERNGIDVDDGFVHAVVFAQDDLSLAYLDQKGI